jgi:hypothetical protein
MTTPVDPQNPTNYGPKGVTTSDVDTTIQPRDMSQEPTLNPAPATTPSSPSYVETAPTQPTQTPQTTAAQPQSQPPTPRHLSSRIFDGVLQTLGGGPIFVTKTDPNTGETSRVPVQQSRGQLGKSILAGALAGMFGGMGARDPEGRPDPAKAASEGYQAGAQLHEKVQQKAQQVADEEVSRKQMVMKANLDVAHQTLALNQGKQNMYEKISANNQGGILKDALTYDQSLTDKSQPTAILKSSLSHDEALAALKGHWSDQLAQIDGYRQNSNGDIVPTFTVLNPDVKVKMNEKAAADFARFNPQYRTAWDATDGNIQMSLHQYAVAQNTLNSLDHMDALFAQEAKTLGLKSTDFADAVKSIGPVGMKAVLEAENAIGGGGTPIDALRRLATAQGGAQILAKLGITNDKVTELYNQQVSDAKLAEMGGMGAKAPAAPDKINDTSDLIDQIADPKIQASFKNRLRDKMNNGELDALDEKVRTQLNLDREQAMKQGDPATLAAVADLAIGRGDLTQAKDLFSTSKFSPMAKVNYDLMSAQKATELGLNPVHFTSESMKEKALKDEEFKSTKQNSVGAQLNSFSTFLYHNADAISASNEWKRTNSEFWNTPLNQLEKKFGNDPSYIKFRASLVAPGKEFMNFLNSNRAEHESDIKAVDDILNQNSSPNRIYSALQQLAKTADDRAASLGDQYVGVVGTTYANLLPASAQAALKSIGITSRAAAYSGSLPRNPAFASQPSVQNMKTLTKGNPQDMAIFKQFGAAAGGDFNRAVEMAREHGFIIPVSQ